MAKSDPGSARVSRVGDCGSQSRTSFVSPFAVR